MSRRESFGWVGITENDPWVIVDHEPTGVEVTLIKGVAKTLGSRIEWVEGAEAELMGALERRELDLVIVGLTSDTPWAQMAGITAQYHEALLVVAVPKEELPPEDIDGLEITVEANSEASGLVEDKGAVPNRVQKIESVEGNATALYACINHGGHNPAAANKRSFNDDVAGGGSFEVKNGRVQETLTAGPISAGSFSCPGGQQLVLAAVSYTGIVLTDATNGVTATVPDTSRVFLAI